jgi:molybdopterin synthase catalytic subunit
MQVRVVTFGSLKDVVGSEFQMDVAEGATVGALWAQLREQHPTLARFERSVALAVNQEYSEPGCLLNDGDEVALLPPVSGGAPAIVQELPLVAEHARLQREVIDPQAAVEGVKRGEDGAVCVFDGIVRNNTRGRKTLYLEYDCYPAMAIAEMEKLAVEALSRFAVRDVRLVHRVGCMQIGETSVLIAVASAHRAAAFDACRWLIDTLKKKVPVWKKEFFEDGAVWADGEPFPPEVPTV